MARVLLDTEVPTAVITSRGVVHYEAGGHRLCGTTAKAKPHLGMVRAPDQRHCPTCRRKALQAFAPDANVFTTPGEYLHEWYNGSEEVRTLILRIHNHALRRAADVCRKVNVDQGLLAGYLDHADAILALAWKESD